MSQHRSTTLRQAVVGRGQPVNKNPQERLIELLLTCIGRFLQRSSLDFDCGERRYRRYCGEALCLAVFEVENFSETVAGIQDIERVVGLGDLRAARRDYVKIFADVTFAYDDLLRGNAAERGDAHGFPDLTSRNPLKNASALMELNFSVSEMESGGSSR